MDVVSYRSEYAPEKNMAQNQATKCILASSLNEFTFNYGNDVMKLGNRIYARFLKSVKFDSNPSINNNAKDESVDSSDFPASSISHDPTKQNIEETSVLKKGTNIKPSFLCIDDDNQSISNINESFDHQESFHNRNNNIELLNQQMKTLDDLKQKILCHNQTKSTFTTFSGENEDEMGFGSYPSLDFIPLKINEPSRYQTVRSPSPFTDTVETECDAKIYLTQDHCNSLVTTTGHDFLTRSETNYNVSIRMEWRKIGNILIVHGLPSNQGRFHEALINFFALKKLEPSNKLSSNAPKKREALIKYIRDHLIQLDGPLCNHKDLADVQNLYQQMCAHKGGNTKASSKKAECLRRQLNMILFGRYGFIDGKTHLDALQKYLRKLNRSTLTNISFEMRRNIVEHLSYIFSEAEHENYEDIIRNYHEKKRQNTLPSLNLDRKLLGLKINIYSGTSLNVTMRNTLPEPPVTLTTNQQNKSNVIPSSIDIQINVSTPSSNRPLSSYHSDTL